MKPCKRGHISGRYRSGDCIQCAKDRAIQWTAANRDRRKFLQLRYIHKHKEKVKQRNEAWNISERGKQYKHEHYLLNKESYYKKTMEWCMNNREKRRAMVAKSFNKDIVHSRALKSINKARRFARQRGAGGNFMKADIDALIIAQCGRCNICLAELVKIHIDHIIPIARGGHTNPSNLQLLCPTCNLSKGIKIAC